MLEKLLTPSNIVFVVGLCGIAFSIFRYFKDPQTAEEKKAALLAQQVNLTAASVDRRFSEVQQNFKELLLQSNNHIKTVDTKVDALTGSIIELGKDVVKLSTIIDERMPKK